MGHDLHNNLLENGWSQHVNKPMRGDNILDLIFSTEFITSNSKVVSFTVSLERRAYLHILYR